MKDFYAIDKGKYQIYVDFAGLNSKDYAVQHIWEMRDGKEVMISSKILGKASDFTDEKRCEYLIKRQEEEVL